MGRTLRFRPTTRVGLVGFVFFLSIVATTALGGCGDDASSPVEEGEQERGVEEVVEPGPKPPEEAEAAKEKPEAAPPPAPEPEDPAPVAGEANADSDGVASEPAAPVPAPQPIGDGATGGGPTATVARVVDGDTIEISPAIDGVTDVRLVGVDTPETKEPGCAPQPYGPEASSHAESVLSGREVTLEFDEEKTDRYDRLLAYVYPQGGEMFNEDLLEEGLAQAYPYPPNTKYADRFAAAQEQARNAGLGIWSLGPDGLALLTDRGNGIGGDGCSPLAPEPPQYQESAPQYEAPAAPPPVPDAPAAPPVGGDLDCEDFGSLAEVQESIAAGDPHGLDGDGDGSACESQF